MKPGITAHTALVIGAVIIVLSGCEKKEEPAKQTVYENKVEIRLNEDAAEHIGKEIHEATAKGDKH